MLNINRTIYIIAYLLLLPISKVKGARWDLSLDGSDLYDFVSRPDIRSPTMNVTIYDKGLTSDDYFFLAPYTEMQNNGGTSLYSPLQVGPHIYDSTGELIWSGAHLFKNRPAFDFKPTYISGNLYLSFILLEEPGAGDYRGGAYIILDQSYQIYKIIRPALGRGTSNMHEFMPIENGNRSLTIITKPKFVGYSSVSKAGPSGWMVDEGFVETDLGTGDAMFQWWALDHLYPSESSLGRPYLNSEERPWDFFHANSVDKTTAGDFILSARHTSTVYLISGIDGSIKWRLGGKHSDFVLNGFNFSYQHDARMLFDDMNTTIISLLDNASWDGDMRVTSSNVSSALVISLNKVSGVASRVDLFPRPDGGLTRLRGNLQELPNGNYFVCWSDNNYVSEYHRDSGKMLMKSELSSVRMTSYRSFRHPWSSRAPQEPPVLRPFLHTDNTGRAVTSVYMSWNGATQVSAWKVFGVSGNDTKLLAEEPRRGFETSLMLEGHHELVLATAIDTDGYILGSSQQTKSFEKDRGDPVANQQAPYKPYRSSTHSEDEKLCHNHTSNADDVTSYQSSSPIMYQYRQTRVLPFPNILSIIVSVSIYHMCIARRYRTVRSVCIGSASRGLYS